MQWPNYNELNGRAVVTYRIGFSEINEGMLARHSNITNWLQPIQKNIKIQEKHF